MPGDTGASTPTVIEHVPRYYRPVYKKVETKQAPVVPLLILTSYSHVPPLTPPPRLKYDCRAISDPPKSIRDAHTGISKKLRDHMLHQESFVDLLDRAEGEIQAKMQIAEKEYHEGLTPTSPTLERRRTWSQQKYSDDEAEDEDDEDEASEDEDKAGDEDDDTKSKDRPVLRVGVFCERGQHRSVAFVEELATRDFPKSWEVQIKHRDLGKKKGANNKRAGRKPPVRSASLVLDDD
jgi:BMFP domain-containing protein YqiC